MGVLAAALAGVAGAAVLGPLGGIYAQRRARRTGRYECALRAPHEQQTGLTSHWRHGSACATPGRLEFRPGGPAGFRFPRGAPFLIEVLAASAEEGRRTTVRQAWWISPGLRMATLRTFGGTVELAADRPALTQLLLRLEPPGG